MIPARILGTGGALAGEPRATAELAARALPGKDPAAIERRIGIRSRRWAPPGTTAAALGAAALSEALAAAGLDARDLRRVIFVSSTGGDALIPATANAVLEALGVDGTCDAFDVNNACTGFLTAFDLAARSVATGLGPAAVVAAEIFSRHLPPDRPRPFLVLGDAAAAAILGPGRPGEGVVATSLRNTAALRGRVVMEHPGLTGAPAWLDFRASYEEIGESALDALRSSCAEIAALTGVSPGEAEWFVPHQPNGAMLDQIVAALGVSPGRVASVVGEIGSVGAASIPFSLDRLLRSRDMRPGDRILMAAVGAGTGQGAILYRVAPDASFRGAA
ncbi:MAG: 3-oxoacyl-ACP synthase III family protein [Polyangiaceae bacterium]|nr:3-oxoacyl-ACP synthase III family protein [Polyangiaceae bacterium]